MMIKKLLIMIVATLTAATCAFAAGNADALLDRAAAELAKGSLTASYTAKSPDGTVNGSLTMSGRRFTISAGNINLWYDGKTLWAYSRRAAEVNISEPTADELAEVAPLAIIGAFRKAYAAKELNAPKGQKKVQLTARDRHANIRAITVTLNASTMLPAAMTVSASNGTSMTVTVTAIKRGKTLPASSFTFPASRYKGVETVDMR